MRSIIIGGDGTVGHALSGRLRGADADFIATTRRTNAAQNFFFDLSLSPEQWPALPQADIVFLCAAVTKLDACEDAPTQTHRINVTHMQALTERLQAAGAYVIFLSTNQVFDGEKPFRRADEATNPRNNYGRQKAEFEAWLLDRPHKAAVLRLTKVIPPGPLPIFQKWQDIWNTGGVVDAFEDLRFAPLPLASVLDGMQDLAARRVHGIFQLSGAREWSYYDIACTLAEKNGIAPDRVKHGSALASGIRPKFLPPYGTLDNTTMAHIAVPEFLGYMGL